MPWRDVHLDRRPVVASVPEWLRLDAIAMTLRRCAGCVPGAAGRRVPAFDRHRRGGAGVCRGPQVPGASSPDAGWSIVIKLRHDSGTCCIICSPMLQLVCACVQTTTLPVMKSSGSPHMQRYRVHLRSEVRLSPRLQRSGTVSPLHRNSCEALHSTATGGLQTLRSSSSRTASSDGCLAQCCRVRSPRGMPPQLRRRHGSTAADPARTCTSVLTERPPLRQRGARR